jgi:radical SAM protein with 4Fe4S-binding SPASM domain
MEYNKELLKESKTFCLAPWLSVHTWPDGRTYPCCLWSSHNPVGNVNDQTLEEIWNNDKMKQTRTGMLNGEKISSCKRCYHLEETGDKSYRKRINKKHWDKIEYVDHTDKDGELDIMNLHLWDIRISNFCNFKCRSCGLGLSSSWYSDTVALGNKADKALININDKASFMDMLEPHYSCVDEIYFAGGEPLVMPEHYQILDKLIKLGRTDVNIRYSTNFSKMTFKNKHIFDYWKYFTNLELYISIDGVGKIGEYVRKGYDDNLFASNVKDYQNSNIKATDYAYAITYGTLNYLHLFDMVLNFIERDFIDKDAFKGSRTLFFSPIDYPAYYDSVYLPDRYKEAFSKRLSNFGKELDKTGISSYVREDILEKLDTVYKRSITKDFDINQMTECKIMTDKLDKIRKEKFDNVFDYYESSDDFIRNSNSMI